MAMMRNLESCSGNDALMSESDMRRTSRTLPIALAGSDFVFSGFGSIQRYDNMFGPSNFNAEDIDDFLAMQRDWGIDGGLRTVAAARLAAVRREAAEACRAVYAHLGLADFTDEHVERAVDAAGSKDLGETDTLAVLAAAQAIRQRGLTVVDIVAALDECGYEHEAEQNHGLRPGQAVGRLPADVRHLRRAVARAVPGHRPERLRGSGHRLRALAVPAGRDRRHPPGPRGRRPAGRAGAVRGRPALRGGPGPARAGRRATSSSASRRPSDGTCGGACPGWR